MGSHHRCPMLNLVEMDVLLARHVSPELTRTEIRLFCVLMCTIATARPASKMPIALIRSNRTRGVFA